MTNLMETDLPQSVTVHRKDDRMSAEEELIQMSIDQIERDVQESNLKRNQIQTDPLATNSSDSNEIIEILSDENTRQYIVPDVFDVVNEMVENCCRLVESCKIEQRLYGSADGKLEERSECAMEECGEQAINTPVIFIPPYDFSNHHEITKAVKDFTAKQSKNCFLKGCKWSPDGTCLLTNSDDGYLRLFDLPLNLYEKNVLTSSISSLPELSAVLTVKIGGLVYDYSWFPYMTSMDPETCCFVSTSSNTPVQLWDAFTGQLRASYRGFDQYDEVVAATSVAFSPTGDKLYCGYNNCIKIFSSDKPGRDYKNINIKDVADQRGIVSCIAVNPCMPNIFAVGTYLKSVGLYSDDGTALCLLRGQLRGLTHIQFSPDGSLLYTGGRKHNDILCWDIRNLGQVLYTVQRSVTTNQRIYFDISNDGKYLVSGSTDGNVIVWDTTKYINTDNSDDSIAVLNPIEQWTAHNDCTNGVSIHRHLPLLATSSGQRHVSHIEDECDLSPNSCTSSKIENCIKLWWIGPKEKCKT